MSHDADRDMSAPDAEANYVQDMVRRLVLMKETGPKSAAWHRARVRAIWRLHRRLERQVGSHPSKETRAESASAAQAQERKDAKADDDRA